MFVLVLAMSLFSQLNKNSSACNYACVCACITSEKQALSSSLPTGPLHGISDIANDADAVIRK